MYQNQRYPNTALGLPSTPNRKIRKALHAALTDLGGLFAELSATQPNTANHIGCGELLLLLRQIARGVPPGMQSFESLLRVTEEGRPKRIEVPQ